MGSALEDKKSPSLILCMVSSSQIRFKPMEFFSSNPEPSSFLLKRIVWSMVLKAVDRSRKVGAVTMPASIDARKSLGILRTVVSVD